jgi:hydroxymethylpyrimidine/phosphomethylpyrimidine kinase
MGRVRPPCVLTIAGSDSGAGAGLQADARTIGALGGYAATVVTTVTAQNARGVRAWSPVPAALITAQIDAVLDGLPVAAIKTGLLTGAAVRAVARALARRPDRPLVVDPVLQSTSGTRFLHGRGLRALQRELLPRAALVTPNWPEAAVLTGRPVRSAAEAEAAARRMIAAGCRAVLVKGGHGRGPLVRDCLVTADGRTRWFAGPRIKTKNTHGTGCVLSAAIAFELARGRPLPAAVAAARRFLRASLRRHRGLRLGPGRGPAFPG